MFLALLGCSALSHHMQSFGLKFFGVCFLELEEGF
jgi:hypothetical protein